MRLTDAFTSLRKKKMKSVLDTLQNELCRSREISENERITFQSYEHLQRYHPALDIFKTPDTIFSQKNLELPSKFVVNTWLEQDEKNKKIWKTKISSGSEQLSNPSKTFVKIVHLLNPIDMIKEKYTCPEHPLLPQSETTWKNTLLKLHSHNNQAYVDTVANFVLSRFRELDLTPHCVLYYGATTGISKSYQFNISNEYDTYKQCRWFWKGMKSHSARLTLVRGESEIIPNFDELYKEITTCPFDMDDTNDITDNIRDDVTDDVTDDITDNDSLVLPTTTLDLSDAESIQSISFDNIEEKADNVKDIFEINKKITNCNSSIKNDDADDADDAPSASSASEHSSGSDADSSETDEFDVDVCLEIPNMPVILIYQEAQEGVLDDLLEEDEVDGHARGTQGWEARWIAWLFQVVSALTFLQSTLCFTHNDLHSNNILWRATDKKFLYYKSKDGTTWRVPTFGKIFSIIDFGRAIFRLGNHLWVSDDHWPNQDAGDQYNFGPFFDHNKPKVQPNPSFDLCRLSVSLIDGLFDDTPPKKKGKGISIMSQEDNWKVFETNSPLYNLLWSWTVDDLGRTVYEDKDGQEKYEGFDLYVRIAHDVHNCVPKDQLHKPIFSQFKWKQKVSEEEKIYSLGI